MKKKEYSSDPGDDQDVTVLMWRISAKQWRDIRKAVSDPGEWSSSYEKWKAKERKSRSDCVAKGYTVVDVPFALDRAETWCREKKFPLNTRSLAKYVLAWYAGNKKSKTALSK